VPLPFCRANDSLYVRLPLTGRKGSVLQANDRVCLEVDAFSESLDEYAPVLIKGRLVLVSYLDEKAQVKPINDRKYNRLRNGYRPGPGRASALADLPVRKIDMTQIGERKKSLAPSQVSA